MNIVVAVDFEFCGTAQCEVLNNLDCANLHIKVVHVTEPLLWELQTSYPYASPVSDIYVMDQTDSGANLVNSVADKLVKLINPKEILTEVREGDVVREIIQCANDFDAQLICLGSHGKVGIEKFVFGSVSNSVSLHADCPVLVAKMPAGLNASMTGN